MAESWMARALDTRIVINGLLREARELRLMSLEARTKTEAKTLWAKAKAKADKADEILVDLFETPLD